MEDKMVRILFTPIIREALTNGETVKLNKNQEELIQNILLEEVQFQNQKLKRIDSRFDEELFNSLCHYLKPFFYDITYALENGQKNAREKIGKGIRNEISKNDLTQYVDITTAADVLNLTKKGVMYYVDTKRELAIPENFKMKNKFELNTFLKFSDGFLYSCY